MPGKSNNRHLVARRKPETRPLASATGNARGAHSRKRLLNVALDVFGRHGYEGVSTRLLANRAKVNLSAIPYYFGGKEGLYLAVAEHVAGQISQQQKPGLLAIDTALADPGLSRRAAYELLVGFVESFAIMIIGKQADRWARFIIREQMDPSPAFDVLYTSALSPIHSACTRLVGHLLDRRADDETVLIKTTALLGQVLVFRAARGLVLRRLAWVGYGTEQVAMIQSVVRAHLALIFDPGKGGRS